MDRIELQVQNERLQFIKSLSKNGEIDDLVRMAFKDSILNSVRNDSSQGPAPTDLSMQPLCLSSFATELGFRFSTNDLISIGKTLKGKYVDKYGSPPGKHEQLVNGAVRLINLYTKRDRAMAEQVMREHHSSVERHKALSLGKTLNHYFAHPGPSGP
jgi:hypothetical protein